MLVVVVVTNSGACDNYQRGVIEWGEVVWSGVSGVGCCGVW